MNRTPTVIPPHSPFCPHQSPHWTSCPLWLTAELLSTSTPRDQWATARGGVWAKPPPPNIPSRAPLQLLSIQVSEQPRCGHHPCVLSAGVSGRICRIEPQHSFIFPRTSRVWELPSQLLWFLSFSCLIIFFILTIRPRCFALLIFLLLPPTVCCSPPPPLPPAAAAEREINIFPFHHQPSLSFSLLLLLWISACTARLLRRGIYICIDFHSPPSGHHHFFSLWGIYYNGFKCALWTGENINALCAAWTTAVRLGFLEQVFHLEMMLWSGFVRINTGSGYKVNKLPRSAICGALILCWFIFFLWTYNLVVLRRIRPSRGSQTNNGGLDTEILFWSFAYCLQSGRVPGAHPGVHLLEHNKYQVSGAQAALTSWPPSYNAVPVWRRFRARLRWKIRRFSVAACSVFHA